MLNTRLETLLVALLLMMPSVCPAFDLTLPWMDHPSSFEITETMVFDHHDNNFDGQRKNDNYQDLRNRLNLSLSVDDFSIGVRADTATFFNAPQDTLPNNSPYLDRYAPEKIWASYRAKWVDLTAGDFYATFGRGMALRVRKIDELSEDTTLLGAKARFRFSPIQITALAGLSNPTNTDAITEKTIANTFDLLSGVEGSWRITNWIGIGAHGVMVLIDPFSVNDQDESRGLAKKNYIGGLTVDLPKLSDWGTLYTEFNWMGKEIPVGAIETGETVLRNGWAGYLGGNFSFGDLSANAELKTYKDFQMYVYTPNEEKRYQSIRLDYILPPTLESEEFEVNNNYNVSGGRLKLDWRLWGGKTLLTASYGAFLATDQGMGSSPGKRFIYHAIAGLEQDFLSGGRTKLAGGIYEEVPDYSGAEHRNLLHLDASIKIPLAGNHSLDFHGRNWWQHRLIGPSRQDYLEGEWTLGYSWSPLLTLNMILGYNTQYSGKQKLETFFVSNGGVSYRQVFLAGSASVNLFSSRLIIRLLAGQMRGGQKCIGGACRIFPPFSGVRTEVVVRF